MGKLLLTTAIFTDRDEANKYMNNNKDEGVIAVYGNLIFLANLYDHGVNYEN